MLSNKKMNKWFAALYIGCGLFFSTRYTNNKTVAVIGLAVGAAAFARLMYAMYKEGVG